jgi:hypothetical protein
LEYGTWARELVGDPDADFILNGVKYGFDIVDPEAKPISVEVSNHPSAVKGPNRAKVDAQVREEIINGNYVEVDSPPIIVSPLGAIPKEGGKVRLIHDCSRPEGKSVNSYVSDMEKFKFQSVDDAANCIKQGYYMAKVDLKSAYRSVSISKRSQQVTGLKWALDGHEKYYVDTKLPFGAKMAPGIFHRLSQAVTRFMSNRGFHNVVAYLDDFFITEPTMGRCAEALKCLIYLLRELGFNINWNKVVDPCQTLTFLGIEVDSRAMILRLSEEKLIAINAELTAFSGRSRASKKQLQSLVGKLNWAAAVVHGGRVFLRRIIDTIVSLKCSHHKARLGPELMADISWWQNFMEFFNGRSVITDNSCPIAAYTDACQEGGGGHCGDKWFYVNWNLDCPKFASSHINVKEVLAAVSALQIWAPIWENSKVLLFTDNITTVASINKGTSRNRVIMSLIRYLFWLAACHNINIKACHIKGINNVKADLLSRLHEVQAFGSRLNPVYECIHPDHGGSFLLFRHGRSADQSIAGCEGGAN